MVTRKFRRFPVSMSGTVIHNAQFKHKGVLRDLSFKGCRIECLISPFTGMQVSLLIHVSDNANGRPVKIDNAAIRWCGSHGIGMEFLTVEPSEQDRLGTVLQEIEAKVST